jgi:hypothetical protein
MENLYGGNMMTYCEIITYWIEGGSGYQGSAVMLEYAADKCHYFG